MLKRFILMALLLTGSHTGLAETFEEGKDYVIVKQVNERQITSGKVEVIEFFSYGCPWCYKLESSLNEWAADHKKIVHFDKIPVVYNKSWAIYAKAFYTIQALAPSTNISQNLFNAILHEKKHLNTDKAMIEFLTREGIDRQTAESAIQNSPAIDLEVKNGQQLMTQYQITAIPAALVHKKYKTDLRMAKNQARFFEILTFLVEKSQREND